MRRQVYTASLVPADLRHEECLLQAADALDHLDFLSRSITDRVSRRTAELRERLQRLHARLDVARAKVDAVRGSHKATKVFSSYKYPVEDGLREYVSAFVREEGEEEERPPRSRVPRTAHTTPDDQVLKEKLQFFNVRTPGQQPAETEVPREGVGPLPPSTDSICSLLLFNTSENPYTNYAQLDPLSVFRKGPTEERPGPFLDAAPVSIGGGPRGELRGPGGTFSYQPGPGRVPLMDVPLALPDLPGVADDLSYSVEQECPIAPSWPAGADLPELPEIAPEAGLESGPGAEPEPPDVPLAVAAAIEVPDVPAAVHAPEVPDRPPGSAPAVQREVPADDARASLLESIRRARGRPKLRSNVERREKVPPPAGDLMSDLRSKLQLRRKGISGANQKESDASSRAGQETVVSPLDRMRDTIPAPSEEDGDTTGTDEGWNESD